MVKYLLKNSPKGPALPIFGETLSLMSMRSKGGTKRAGSLRWSQIRSTLASTVVLRYTQDTLFDLFTRQNDLRGW